jgi:hypothetical protein
MFQTLFSKSTRQNGFISEMGSMDKWTWKLFWAETLSQTEAVSEHELLNLLEPIRPYNDGVDRRKWIPNTAGFFSVKSAYLWLQNRIIEDILDDSKLIALKKMWKNNVPLKVSIFGWRLLLEKLPSRETLFHGGVLTNTHERSCVFCFNTQEREQHIVLNCCMTDVVWRHIYKWMDIPYVNAGTLQQHFLLFGDVAKGTYYKGVKHII